MLSIFQARSTQSKRNRGASYSLIVVSVAVRHGGQPPKRAREKRDPHRFCPEDGGGKGQVSGGLWVLPLHSMSLGSSRVVAFFSAFGSRVAPRDLWQGWSVGCRAVVSARGAATARIDERVGWWLEADIHPLRVSVYAAQSRHFQHGLVLRCLRQQARQVREGR